MSNYGTAIDKKWQKKWEETELYKFNPDAEGEKLYVLEMFSYPSGSQLHAGHWFNYGPVDSWARLKKMQGYNVFQPMGFDAFGLPAENFAIKTGIHPWDSTEKNIKTMEQVKAEDVAFANKSQQKNNFRGAVKVEKEPEWLNQEPTTEEELLPEDVQAKFEERLKKFREGAKQDGN